MLYGDPILCQEIVVTLERWLLAREKNEYIVVHANDVVANVFGQMREGNLCGHSAHTKKGSTSVIIYSEY